MEMGLLPGTSVRMVRVAPLRDPLELRLRDYSLSVRRSDAARISVLAREPA
jgi:Fe2+ transport system protein FeoA